MEDMAVFLHISQATLYRKIKLDERLAEALKAGRRERKKARGRGPYRKMNLDYWKQFSIYRRQKSFEMAEQKRKGLNSGIHPASPLSDKFKSSEEWLAHKIRFRHDRMKPGAYIHKD